MLASPSFDETGATTTAKRANDRPLTILLTKLDAVVEQIREALRRADRESTLAHVDELRKVLLKETLDEATGRATAWERVLGHDDESP